MMNKELIYNFYREFFNEHRIECADKYVKEDYIQHNPGVAQGRESLKKAFADKFISDPQFHLEIVRMIEEDNMIAVYLKNVDAGGKTVCRVVDTYRVEEGKLAEHWDIIQMC